MTPPRTSHHDLDASLPQTGAEVHYNPDLFFVVCDVDPHHRPGKEFAGAVTRGIDMGNDTTDEQLAEGPDFFDLMLDHRMCDGFRDISMCNSRNPMYMERVRELLESGRVNQFVLGIQPMYKLFARGAYKAGMTVFEYLDMIYQTMFEMNEKFGCWRVRFEMIGEISNSVLWPDEGLPDKQAAGDFYRRWYTSGLYTSIAWDQMMPEEGFSFFRDALERGGGTLRKMFVSNTTTIPFDLHEGFQLGVPVGIFEGYTNNPLPQQLCLAFARGGARHHDALWGTDNSPWADFTHTPTRTTRLGEYLSGLTPEAMLRGWVCQYMAGANFLMHESSDWFFFTEKAPGVVVPSPHGLKAIEFYDFARRRHPRRGQLVTPFALMMERDHGFGSDWWRRQGGAVPDIQWPRIFGAAVPMLDEDWMMYRFVEAAYPMASEGLDQATLLRILNGHRGVDEQATSEFEETYARLARGEEDPNKYNRYLHDTPWGDSFDVIQENCEPAVLTTYYKAVFLMGGVKLEGKLLERLRSYVDDGGMLIVNHKQIEDWDAAFLGVEPPTCLDQPGDGWRPDDTGGLHPERFAYAVSESSGAKVWVRDNLTGHPLVLEHLFGRGRVITVMADWLMTCGQEHWLDLGRWLMDRLHELLCPVRLSGERGHYMVNQLDDALVITLMNHRTSPLRTTVRIRQDALTAIDTTRIGDWWRNLPYDPSRLRREHNDFVIDLVVRPNGFIVLGIGHEVIEEEFHDLSCFLESNMGFNDEVPGDDVLEKIRQSIADYRHQERE